MVKTKPPKKNDDIKAYFTDYFGVLPESLKAYNAFNISLLNDLPLFIDPFLLFNSKNPKYKELHESIIKYLKFLRDKSTTQQLDKSLVTSWYSFKEVKQTWLGFALRGNKGSGLGKEFATSLYRNLHRVFADFGEEEITKSSHLEKLCLFKDRVGKDNISDFTTNLIKEYLLEYTQEFAQKYIHKNLRKTVKITKVRFNYETESWESDNYDLPYLDGDYVILTPIDMLTKDDTWINRTDLFDDFEAIPYAINNDELRAQVNNYFAKVLPEDASNKETHEAIRKTISEYPEILDYYIRWKEDNGNRAVDISALKVKMSENFYVNQFKNFINQLASITEFYQLEGDTYDEAFARVQFLKDVIENKDGYRYLYQDSIPIKKESDLHILYRLTWFATPSDVNREVNNGRGPVDFKISRGRADSTLVEFKLAKNTRLKDNLQKQVEIYKEANNTRKAIKVIFYFSHQEYQKVTEILKELKLENDKNIILINARRDDKISASKA